MSVLRGGTATVRRRMRALFAMFALSAAVGAVTGLILRLYAPSDGYVYLGAVLATAIVVPIAVHVILGAEDPPPSSTMPRSEHGR